MYTFLVKTGKTKYMKVFFGMVANERITICNNSYEKVKTFKYIGPLLTDKNPIYERIKFRRKAGISCYSVQTLLFSRLPSKNLEIKIYKTIILPILLYGCET